jgi:hypothetical protein
MTITTPMQQDIRKDGQVDRRIDVHTDARKAGSEGGGGPADAGFVIVLANHLCRIRHRWFCAESPVMPGRCARWSGCSC